jgi:hypothetical protein
MRVPTDEELRELLRRDIAPPREGKRGSALFRPVTGVLRTVVRTLCWIGLMLSIALLGIGVWLFFYGEPIITTPFMMGALLGGIMLGAPCLGYLVTGKGTAPPMPF